MDINDENKEELKKEEKENTDIKTFEWCGYNWKSEMDGGRIIHPDSPWYWYSQDTIKVCENNVLELGIRKNPREVKHWTGKVYHPEYEVATMRSIESFRYGTYSADIMMPEGMNLWPSFWLTGDGNWPPEIDIMEGWSGNNKYFKWMIAQPPYISPSWRTTTNVHYNDSEMKHKSIGTRNISWFRQKKNPTTNYLKYKCIWEPSRIIFAVDDIIVRKVTGQVCEDLVKNLGNPEKGYNMNVIFNVWCEDPSKYKIDIATPMKIKNFKFEPYTIYYMPRKN